MGKTRPVDADVIQFFANPAQPLHRQYLALRRFLYEDKTAEEVAEEYGYTAHSVYAMAKNFKIRLRRSEQNGADLFFQDLRMGRPRQERDNELIEIIVNFRKKQLSVPDIKIFRPVQ